MTTGADLEESVMNMVQLEEQAQLNAWAFSLMGRDHPYTSDELLAEAAAQPPFWQVPHFRWTRRQRARRAAAEGSAATACGPTTWTRSAKTFSQEPPHRLIRVEDTID